MYPLLVVFGLGACGAEKVRETGSGGREDPCGDGAELPVAPQTPGDGTSYCGMVCITVEAALAGERKDVCAGSLALRVGADTLTGTGLCSYQGIPGERGFGEMFSGPQGSSVQGERVETRWSGEVLVQTPVGPFTWPWTGEWSGAGTPIRGELRGSSAVEVGQARIEVSGTGIFRVSPEFCPVDWSEPVGYGTMNGGNRRGGRFSDASGMR